MNLGRYTCVQSLRIDLLDWLKGKQHLASGDDILGHHLPEKGYR
jgi:hypothetical protein